MVSTVSDTHTLLIALRWSRWPYICFLRPHWTSSLQENTECGWGVVC